MLDGYDDFDVLNTRSFGAQVIGDDLAAAHDNHAVDRAVNGRAGVSAANRQRVLTAARDLGYLPSEGMFILPSRPARIEFLIPFGHNAFMHDVIDSITEFDGSLPLVETCQIVPLGGIGPEALLPVLEQLSLKTEGIGVITTDHPHTRQVITALCQAGVRVVTLASDLTGTPRSAYVGVDNRAAGRTALFDKRVFLAHRNYV